METEQRGLKNWWNRITIARKLYFSLGIMATLIVVELLTLWFAVSTLSSVRACVGGEGLWSKAQKNAIYDLRSYASTRDEKDFESFKNFMKVSEGDRKARMELAKSDPDMDVVRRGFLEGRNHPSDIDGMASLFTKFHRIYYINRAIELWTIADTTLARLVLLGEELHREISSASPSQEKVENLVKEISPLNRQLTALEDDFSFTLGEGSRWLENLILKILLSVAFTVEISGLLLTISVSRGISKGLNEINRAAEKIASGNFGERAKVFSEDEIGVLADSINHLSDDLKVKTSERNEAEANFLKQKELYESLLNAQSEIGEGVSITEGEKIIYVNDAVTRIYGYRREEILQMSSFFQLIPEEERETIMKRFHKRASGQDMLDKGETVIIQKDGRRINLEYSLKRVLVGDKVQWISIIRDITEKIKAQNTMVLHTEELKQINDELQQFAYVASHDLQEPLRSVISYLQLIEKRYKTKLDAEADEFIHYAVDGAARMHVLINDLLTYSRIGTQAATFEPVNTTDAIKTALNNLRSAIEESNALVMLEGELPVILAERTQITQLFQNLIGNAIKFRSKEENPKIQIGVQDDTSHWRFYIKDNGIGIPSEYAKRVFVIFQRLHTRKDYPGTGIGLALCKKIVERHKGKIWVESKAGEGSTFFFTIKK